MKKPENLEIVRKISDNVKSNFKTPNFYWGNGGFASCFLRFRTRIGFLKEWVCFGEREGEAICGTVYGGEFLLHSALFSLMHCSTV
jgi:hypothetical protein